MINKFKAAVKDRYAALRASEDGMEAAQVILILAVVVVVLIPVISMIVGALQGQGEKITNNINGY